MRSASPDDFALAVASSIEALKLCRNGSTINHRRMVIAHLRTIQTLISVPLEGKGEYVSLLLGQTAEEFF